MDFSGYLIGIDLGTTNSAVAYVNTREAITGDTPAIHNFEVLQVIAEGELGSRPTLPSFLYFAGEQDVPGSLRLPWDEHPKFVAGVFAREQGALVPGRQVNSAKSWLSHDAVDRTARILPWGAGQMAQLGQTNQSDLTCSPVEASTRYLAHLRDSWNHAIAASDDELRFERQEIVLTVPASFDEEARELTVKSARDAGFVKLTLLEEPLAAFYAWITARRRSLKRFLKDGDLVLICDVGGGTTDFSLIRVQIVKGEIRFERIAIGEHLLLGGDNVDLALAHRVLEKLGNPKLDLRQQNALRRACCSAKERLLGDGRLKRVPLSVLGGGRTVVGGTLSTELTREEVEETLLNGFLPVTTPTDLPPRTRRTGLRELGLPYDSEPAITKHLAEFLTKAGSDYGMREGEIQDALPPQDTNSSNTRSSARSSRSSPHRQSANIISKSIMIRPDAVLFNGGFFAPPITRDRIIDTVAGWFADEGEGWRPKVLSNEAPESAVAVGAAYYGHVRKSGGLRISGGSARAYYIGVQSGVPVADGRVQAVCVLPRGTEEGTTLNLESREFMALANRPVTFTLYSSTTGHDAHGDVVALNEEEVHRHAPLITTLRFGKKSKQVELAVRLIVYFTEVGTLELWCESLKSEHRWRLLFQLRGFEPAPDMESESDAEETQTVISDESLDRAESMIRAVFGAPGEDNESDIVTPETLVSKIEGLFGYGKDAWPMITIRNLCDLLADVADGRKKGAKFEARWLNLFGFCLRPGFGAPADDWRIAQARKIYMAGLIFPKELQCQIEWLVLWRRLAGGWNANQQNEIFHRIRTAIGVGGKKLKGRLNTQVEREGWRLLASLEHLPGNTRVALGQELLGKIKEHPGNKSFLWSLGRLGARIPLYGPLNCVVPAESAGQWIKSLLQLADLSPDIASAIVQLGALTGDPQRDIESDLRWSALVKLNQAGMTEGLLESLREYVPPGRSDAVRIFGESLPEGLRFVD
jgi:DNA-K related protein/Hsp70 protein